MKNRNKIIIIAIIFVVAIAFFSRTYAYWSWETASEQETSVAFTVEKEFSCSVDGGGAIEPSSIVMMPSSCTNSAHAVMREVKVTADIANSDNSVYMDLWMEINALDTELSDSVHFKYALTTSPTSCVDGVVAGGTFNSKTVGDKIEILSKNFTDAATDTYYLYVWLDKTETDPVTAGKTFNLSLNGECINDEKTAYAVYSADDTSLTFYKTSDEITAGTTYNGKTATAVYTGFETNSYTSSTIPWASYKSSITSVTAEDTITPVSTASWFYNFSNCSHFDLAKLDTSKVTSMASMFNIAADEVDSVNILGLSSWNTSNVTDMYKMFTDVGKNASSVNVGNLGAWDTSKVTNMEGMFSVFAYNTPTWTLGDIKDWDVSSVTDISGMFTNAGCFSTSFSLDLSGWDLKNVTDMSSMFYYAGKEVTGSFNLNLSKWDTSSVTNMLDMFNYAGYKAKTWTLIGLDDWDVGKVTNMSNMFIAAGYNASAISLDLSKWNVSNVTTMNNMFRSFGYVSKSWSIGNIGRWNTENVTDLAYMFRSAGNSASYTLDLSGWDVGKVTSYTDFNLNEESKIKAPNFGS